MGVLFMDQSSAGMLVMGRLVKYLDRARTAAVEDGISAVDHRYQYLTHCVVDSFCENTTRKATGI